MPIGDDTMIERSEDAIFLLDVTYGPRPFTPSGDLEHEFVMAILSQSTTDQPFRRPRLLIPSGITC